MQFVENAQTTVLGTVGFVILIYTVIMMIQKIEDALNFTWHVERPRSLAKRISEYLVIMLIGPMVIVASLVLLTRIEASDALARLSGLAATATGSPGLRAHFAPYLLVIGLFWFVYWYMPNTRVRWQSAFIGALFGGTAWVAVGAVFARIAVYAGQTAAIYAGFAIVLLFLVWLHVSWLVMLLGGQICRSTSSTRSTCAPGMARSRSPACCASASRSARCTSSASVSSRAVSAGTCPILRTTWTCPPRSSTAR